MPIISVKLSLLSFPRVCISSPRNFQTGTKGEFGNVIRDRIVRVDYKGRG